MEKGQNNIINQSINQSINQTCISLSMNLCLKIGKMMDYYLREFEYAMENVRLGQ